MDFCFFLFLRNGEYSFCELKSHDVIKHLLKKEKKDFEIRIIFHKFARYKNKKCLKKELKYNNNKVTSYE